MKRSTLIPTVLAAAALVALVAWALAPRPVEVEVATAVRGPFELTVDEDARTRLAARYGVSSPLAARLARITLREGDEVRAGDVLARLQPLPAPLLDERSRREQAARVAASEAGVRQAHERMEAARVALARTRDEQQRSELLAGQGFVSPTRLTAERLAVQAAQKELDAAEAGEQVARHELQLARVALDFTRGNGGGAEVELRAPVAGRVLALHQTSAGTVAPGAPLLDIGDTAQLEVVAELLTADALQARPGSAVRIERWGGPVELQGRVRRVEPAAFTKVSALGVEEQRVKVLIDITSPREQWALLGDGYRVGVRIVTRAEARVLKVPVGAVFPLPAPQQGHGVFVVDGRRARLQPVTLKARNGAEAWLAEDPRRGVAEGLRVIVYPAAAVGDGVVVRAR
ncbi:MAG: efflux transporter periplasmic adaptor subunit [Rubrivivax sp. SCN 71-131]|jgi:HlyD family secretion protein|nr:MAG: efflux transporter periplasmic adaptor subunit [Rubrivivax sp. SCN 71-131]